MSFLQEVIDGEILLYERKTAAQGVGRLLWGEPLQTAMADAIVLAQVAVNGIQAVVGLASDDVRFLAFGVSLPANNPLMSQSSSEVVESSAAGYDGFRRALVLHEHGSDPAVAAAEQLREVAVGKQSTLLVRLLAKADRFTQQALGSRQAIDAQLGVLGSGKVEENGDKVDVGDALVESGWVVEADGHPERLTVDKMVFGTHVLEDNLEDHISTQLADTASTDARELLRDPVGEGVPQGFFSKRSEFVANKVRLSTHG
jgi:hypothetical protein